jgi:hypothetical protein
LILLLLPTLSSLLNLSMCYKARASKAESVYQTSNRSTFVTAARFTMALENGLALPDASAASDFFYKLPLLSFEPIAVLTVARVHGAAWHEDLCRDAAFYGNFELLKWLHASGCPRTAFEVAINAIVSTKGQLELILHWVLSIVHELPQEHKNKLFIEAGLMDDLASLELLLQQGAEWPSSFIGEDIIKGESVRACWRCGAVAWALSKGCSWGECRCQDFAPELFSLDRIRADAADLFEWAHENDCPCTCETAAADGAVVAA